MRSLPSPIPLIFTPATGAATINSSISEGKPEEKSSPGEGKEEKRPIPPSIAIKIEGQEEKSEYDLPALKFAKTDYERGVAYEDLCFETQQAAEKSLKALLIHFQDSFPRIHAFHILLSRLEKYIHIPAKVKRVLELSDYAVQTRYPGDYYPITRKEYAQAVKIASDVFGWVSKIIREDSKYYPPSRG